MGFGYYLNIPKDNREMEELLCKFLQHKINSLMKWSESFVLLPKDVVNSYKSLSSPSDSQVMPTWLSELFQASKETLFSGIELLPAHLLPLEEFWVLYSEHNRRAIPKLAFFLLKSQVSSTHLLTASVMSAPASLAVAKLFWPETETPKITLKNAMKMESG